MTCHFCPSFAMFWRLIPQDSNDTSYGRMRHKTTSFLVTFFTRFSSQTRFATRLADPPESHDSNHQNQRSQRGFDPRSISNSPMALISTQNAHKWFDHHQTNSAKKGSKNSYFDQFMLQKGPKNKWKWSYNPYRSIYPIKKHLYTQFQNFRKMDLKPTAKIQKWTKLK